MSEIPTVDLQSCYSFETVSLEDPKCQEVAADLGNALHKLGCAYLVNHGIPQNVITAAFEASKKFFDLPLEVKTKYLNMDVGKSGHGYTAPGQESISGGLYQELKESFGFSGANRIYPEEAPWFRKPSEDLEAASDKLSKNLLRLLAMAIKLDNIEVFCECASNMDDRSIPSINVLRSFLYPGVEDLEVGATRCSEHSDIGLLSLLFHNTIQGLQVKQPEDGKWIDAVPVPESIFLNVGDCLELFTCGYFPAPFHRVIIPENETQRKETRQSIISFLNPDHFYRLYPLRSQVLNPDMDFEPLTTYDFLFGSGIVVKREDGYKGFMYRARPKLYKLRGDA